MIKITYDPVADAMSISLRKGHVDESDAIAPNMIVDYDAEGHMLSIELLQVRSALGIENPLTVHLELLSKVRVKASADIPVPPVSAPQVEAKQAEAVG